MGGGKVKDVDVAINRGPVCTDEMESLVCDPSIASCAAPIESGGDVCADTRYQDSPPRDPLPASPSLTKLFDESPPPVEEIVAGLTFPNLTLPAAPLPPYELLERLIALRDAGIVDHLNSFGSNFDDALDRARDLQIHPDARQLAELSFQLLTLERYDELWKQRETLFYNLPATLATDATYQALTHSQKKTDRELAHATADAYDLLFGSRTGRHAVGELPESSATNFTDLTRTNLDWTFALETLERFQQDVVKAERKHIEQSEPYRARLAIAETALRLEAMSGLAGLFADRRPPRTLAIDHVDEFEFSDEPNKPIVLSRTGLGIMRRGIDQELTHIRQSAEILFAPGRLAKLDEALALLRHRAEKLQDIDTDEPQELSEAARHELHDLLSTLALYDSLILVAELRSQIDDLAKQGLDKKVQDELEAKLAIIDAFREGAAFDPLQAMSVASETLSAIDDAALELSLEHEIAAFSDSDGSLKRTYEDLRLQKLNGGIPPKKFQAAVQRLEGYRALIAQGKTDEARRAYAQYVGTTEHEDLLNFIQASGNHVLFTNLTIGIITMLPALLIGTSVGVALYPLVADSILGTIGVSLFSSGAIIGYEHDFRFLITGKVPFDGMDVGAIAQDLAIDTITMAILLPYLHSFGAFSREVTRAVTEAAGAGEIRSALETLRGLEKAGKISATVHDALATILRAGRASALLPLMRGETIATRAGSVIVSSELTASIRTLGATTPAALDFGIRFPFVVAGLTLWEVPAQGTKNMLTTGDSHLDEVASHVFSKQGTAERILFLLCLEATGPLGAPLNEALLHEASDRVTAHQQQRFKAIPQEAAAIKQQLLLGTLTPERAFQKLIALQREKVGLLARYRDAVPEEVKREQQQLAEQEKNLLAQLRELHRLVDLVRRGDNAGLLAAVARDGRVLSIGTIAGHEVSLRNLTQHERGYTAHVFVGEVDYGSANLEVAADGTITVDDHLHTAETASADPVAVSRLLHAWAEQLNSGDQSRDGTTTPVPPERQPGQPGVWARDPPRGRRTKASQSRRARDRGALLIRSQKFSAAVAADDWVPITRVKPRVFVKLVRTGDGYRADVKVGDKEAGSATIGLEEDGTPSVRDGDQLAEVTLPNKKIVEAAAIRRALRDWVKLAGDMDAGARTDSPSRRPRETRAISIVPPTQPFDRLRGQIITIATRNGHELSIFIPVQPHPTTGTYRAIVREGTKSVHDVILTVDATGRVNVSHIPTADEERPSHAYGPVNFTADEIDAAVANWASNIPPEQGILPGLVKFLGDEKGELDVEKVVAAIGKGWRWLTGRESGDGSATPPTNFRRLRDIFDDDELRFLDELRRQSEIRTAIKTRNPLLILQAIADNPDHVPHGDWRLRDVVVKLVAEIHKRLSAVHREEVTATAWYAVAPQYSYAYSTHTLTQSRVPLYTAPAGPDRTAPTISLFPNDGTFLPALAAHGWKKIVVGRTDTGNGEVQCSTEGNDTVLVRVPDPRLSQRHFVIERRDNGSLTITDLGSANGTKVLGDPLRPNQLHGLYVGNTVSAGGLTWVVGTEGRNPGDAALLLSPKEISQLHEAGISRIDDIPDLLTEMVSADLHERMPTTITALVAALQRTGQMSQRFAQFLERSKINTLTGAVGATTPQHGARLTLAEIDGVVTDVPLILGRSRLTIGKHLDDDLARSEWPIDAAEIEMDVGRDHTTFHLRRLDPTVTLTVNGTDVGTDPVALKDTDTIAIGVRRFQFHLVEPQQSAAMRQGDLGNHSPRTKHLDPKPNEPKVIVKGIDVSPAAPAVVPSPAATDAHTQPTTDARTLLARVTDETLLALLRAQGPINANQDLPLLLDHTYRSLLAVTFERPAAGEAGARNVRAMRQLIILAESAQAANYNVPFTNDPRYTEARRTLGLDPAMTIPARGRIPRPPDREGHAQVPPIHLLAIAGDGSGDMIAHGVSKLTVRRADGGASPDLGGLNVNVDTATFFAEDPTLRTSRQHLDIVWKDGAWVLIDHSNNGTHVNGTLVHNGSVILRDGARVRISENEWVVRIGAQPAAAADLPPGDAAVLAVFNAIHARIAAFTVHDEDEIRTLIVEAYRDGKIDSDQMMALSAELSAARDQAWAATVPASAPQLEAVAGQAPTISAKKLFADHATNPVTREYLERQCPKGKTLDQVTNDELPGVIDRAYRSLVAATISTTNDPAERGRTNKALRQLILLVDAARNANYAIPIAHDAGFIANRKALGLDDAMSIPTGNRVPNTGMDIGPTSGISQIHLLAISGEGTGDVLAKGWPGLSMTRGDPKMTTPDTQKSILRCHTDEANWKEEQPIFAVFAIDQGGHRWWYINNHGATDISVDGRSSPTGELRVLRDGSRIRVGENEWVVRIAPKKTGNDPDAKLPPAATRKADVEILPVAATGGGEGESEDLKPDAWFADYLKVNPTFSGRSGYVAAPTSWARAAQPIADELSQLMGVLQSDAYDPTTQKTVWARLYGESSVFKDEPELLVRAKLLKAAIDAALASNDHVDIIAVEAARLRNKGNGPNAAALEEGWSNLRAALAAEPKTEAAPPVPAIGGGSGTTPGSAVAAALLADSPVKSEAERFAAARGKTLATLTNDDLIELCRHLVRFVNERLKKGGNRNEAVEFLTLLFLAKEHGIINLERTMDIQRGDGDVFLAFHDVADAAMEAARDIADNARWRERMKYNLLMILTAEMLAKDPTLSERMGYAIQPTPQQFCMMMADQLMHVSAATTHDAAALERARILRAKIDEARQRLDIDVVELEAKRLEGLGQHESAQKLRAAWTILTGAIDNATKPIGGGSGPAPDNTTHGKILHRLPDGSKLRAIAQALMNGTSIERADEKDFYRVMVALLNDVDARLQQGTDPQTLTDARVVLGMIQVAKDEHKIDVLKELSANEDSAAVSLADSSTYPPHTKRPTILIISAMQRAVGGTVPPRSTRPLGTPAPAAVHPSQALADAHAAQAQATAAARSPLPPAPPAPTEKTTESPATLFGRHVRSKSFLEDRLLAQLVPGETIATLSPDVYPVRLKATLGNLFAATKNLVATDHDFADHREALGQLVDLYEDSYHANHNVFADADVWATYVDACRLLGRDPIGIPVPMAQQVETANTIWRRLLAIDREFINPGMLRLGDDAAKARAAAVMAGATATVDEVVRAVRERARNLANGLQGHFVLNKPIDEKSRQLAAGLLDAIHELESIGTDVNQPGMRWSDALKILQRAALPPIGGGSGTPPLDTDYAHALNNALPQGHPLRAYMESRTSWGRITSSMTPTDYQRILNALLQEANRRISAHEETGDLFNLVWLINWGRNHNADIIVSGGRTAQTAYDSVVRTVAQNGGTETSSGYDMKRAIARIAILNSNGFFQYDGPMEPTRAAFAVFVTHEITQVGTALFVEATKDEPSGQPNWEKLYKGELKGQTGAKSKTWLHVQELRNVVREAEAAGMNLVQLAAAELAGDDGKIAAVKSFPAQLENVDHYLAARPTRGGPKPATPPSGGSKPSVNVTGAAPAVNLAAKAARLSDPQEIETFFAEEVARQKGDDPSTREFGWIIEYDPKGRVIGHSVIVGNGTSVIVPKKPGVFPFAHNHPVGPAHNDRGELEDNTGWSVAPAQTDISIFLGDADRYRNLPGFPEEVPATHFYRNGKIYGVLYSEEGIAVMEDDRQEKGGPKVYFSLRPGSTGNSQKTRDKILENISVRDKDREANARYVVEVPWAEHFDHPAFATAAPSAPSGEAGDLTRGGSKPTPSPAPAPKVIAPTLVPPIASDPAREAEQHTRDALLRAITPTCDADRALLAAAYATLNQGRDEEDPHITPGDALDAKQLVRVLQELLMALAAHIPPASREFATSVMTAVDKAEAGGLTVVVAGGDTGLARQTIAATLAAPAGEPTAPSVDPAIKRAFIERSLARLREFYHHFDTRVFPTVSEHPTDAQFATAVVDILNSFTTLLFGQANQGSDWARLYQTGNTFMRPHRYEFAHALAEILEEAKHYGIDVIGGIEEYRRALQAPGQQDDSGAHRFAGTTAEAQQYLQAALAARPEGWISPAARATNPGSPEVLWAQFKEKALTRLRQILDMKGGATSIFPDAVLDQLLPANGNYIDDATFTERIAGVMRAIATALHNRAIAAGTATQPNWRQLYADGESDVIVSRLLHAAQFVRNMVDVAHRNGREVIHNPAEETSWQWIGAIADAKPETWKPADLPPHGVRTPTPPPAPRPTEAKRDVVVELMTMLEGEFQLGELGNLSSTVLPDAQRFGELVGRLLIAEATRIRQLSGMNLVEYLRSDRVRVLKRVADRCHRELNIDIHAQSQDAWNAYKEIAAFVATPEARVAERATPQPSTAPTPSATPAEGFADSASLWINRTPTAGATRAIEAVTKGSGDVVLSATFGSGKTGILLHLKHMEDDQGGRAIYLDLSDARGPGDLKTTLTEKLQREGMSSLADLAARNGVLLLDEVDDTTLARSGLGELIRQSGVRVVYGLNAHEDAAHFQPVVRGPMKVERIDISPTMHEMMDDLIRLGGDHITGTAAEAIAAYTIAVGGAYVTAHDIADQISRRRGGNKIEKSDVATFFSPATWQDMTRTAARDLGIALSHDAALAFARLALTVQSDRIRYPLSPEERIRALLGDFTADLATTPMGEDQIARVWEFFARRGGAWI